VFERGGGMAKRRAAEDLKEEIDLIVHDLAEAFANMMVRVHNKVSVAVDEETKKSIEEDLKTGYERVDYQLRKLNDLKMKF